MICRHRSVRQRTGLVLAAFWALFGSGTALQAQVPHYVGVFHEFGVNLAGNIPGIGVGPDGFVAYSSLSFPRSGFIGTIGDPLCNGIGGAYVSAGLISPNGVARSAGRVIFATDVGVVYKFTPDAACNYTASVIDTNVGSTAGAIAVDASGNVYVADPANHRIIKETVSGSQYVHSNFLTGLTNPAGLAVSGTTVYVLDGTDNTIVKYTTTGGAYSATTIRGGAGILPMAAIALDPAGNLYVTGFDLLLKMTPANGSYTVTLITALSSSAVACDTSGNVYTANYETSGGTQYVYGPGVIDSSNHYVQEDLTKITFGLPNSGTTAVGSTAYLTANGAPPPTLMFFYGVYGNNGTTSAVTSAVAKTQGASNSEFSATEVSLSSVSAITAVDTNNVYISMNFAPLFAGTRNGAIQLLDSSGNLLVSEPVSGVGLAPQAAFYPGAQSVPVSKTTLDPEGMAVDSAGNLFIADAANSRVLKETYSSGTYVETTIGTGLSRADSVAIDGAGNVYIADIGNFRVLKETPSGSGYVQSVVATSPNPRAIAIDSNGVVYIADQQKGVLQATPNASGSYTVTHSGSSVTSPSGVAVDSNFLYVADSQNHRVLRGYSTGGLYFENTVGSGNFNPSAVAVDNVGNVIIVDSANGRVLEEVNQNTYGPNGYTEVIAGGGLSSPTAVTVDQAGNLYVGDMGNNRVVKMNSTGPQSLSFPNTAIGTSSAAQTLTLANIGNAALNSAATNSASLSTGFTFDNASTCTTALQGGNFSAGTLCGIALDFVPTVAGPVSGTLTLVDNNLNANKATQTINLIGTGSGGTKTINFPLPTSPMPQGSMDTLMASASNGDLVTYSITSGAATLNGSTITYTTQGSVTITATSAASGTASAAPTVSVTVQVTAPYVASWSPSPSSTLSSIQFSGSALGSGVLNANYPVPASIAYTATLLPNGTAQSVNASTVLPVGSYNLIANITPTSSNYPVSLATVPLTVQNMNPFVANSNGNVSSLYNNGRAANSSVTGGGVGAAVDANGFVWSLFPDGRSLAKFRDDGTQVNSYSSIALNSAKALAIDGSGQVWIANGNGAVILFSNSGTALYGLSSAATNGPTGLAIDMSGNIWISSGGDNSVEEIIGGAAPVAPLANAVANASPGTRP